VFPFCIGTGVGSAGVRPAFSAGGSAPFGRLSRRTVGRGAVLLKEQITLLGRHRHPADPGQHPPSPPADPSVRPKMCHAAKKRQLHIAMCLTVCYNVSLRAR